MSEMVEMMARAGFASHHIRRRLPASVKAWEVTGVEWTAAAQAMVDALTKAGYAIVPREPTEAMIAAYLELYSTNPAFVDVGTGDYWRAMIDAALASEKAV